jgi:hypothetical protein
VLNSTRYTFTLGSCTPFNISGKVYTFLNNPICTLTTPSSTLTVTDSQYAAPYTQSVTVTSSVTLTPTIQFAIIVTSVQVVITPFVSGQQLTLMGQTITLTTATTLVPVSTANALSLGGTLITMVLTDPTQTVTDLTK